MLSCIFHCFVIVSLIACNAADNGSTEPVSENKPPMRKPSSSYVDTLRISGKTAVFFQPDSLQLEKIEAVTDSNIFNGTMHECTYQTKNAHRFLTEQWPGVKCIDTRRHRFLLFETQNKNVFIIDLDDQDPCGLYVFDNKQPPRVIDMTNIETQVSEYFLTKSID